MITKAEIKKELLREFPKTFVELLNEAGIIDELKNSRNEHIIFWESCLRAEIDPVYEKYNEVLGRLHELARH